MVDDWANWILYESGNVLDEVSTMPAHDIQG